MKRKIVNRLRKKICKRMLTTLSLLGKGSKKGVMQKIKMPLKTLLGQLLRLAD
tara:strand:+ start:60904 stop:61062 length:159 start_codon:yes stop_codon:yes gene_type:complete